MDVFKAVETYITRMVSEPSAMKVLLLDTHTVRLYPNDIVLAKSNFRTDTNRLVCFYAIDAAISPSLSHRQDR